MKNISTWARQHIAEARICIVMLKVLLISAAFFIGNSLLSMKIILSEAAGIVFIFLFVLVALVYPYRQNRISKKLFYIKQKSCDFLLATAGFLMMIFFVNNRLYSFLSPSNSYASRSATIKSDPPTAEEILKSLQYRDKKTLTRQEKRILKHEFKKQAKVYVKSKITGHKSEADKALLIILTIIGALGALYLVAALSCSLACNGSDAAALAVAILGLAGVIWATMAIIRRISRGAKKKRPDPAMQ